MRSSTKAPSIFQSFRIPLLSRHEISSRNLEIGSLSRAGNLDAARRLFDGMSNRDVVSWNAIVTAYWQNNDFLQSKKLFDSMPERNIISWNTMIAGCLRNCLVDEAFKYFLKMPERNVASWNVMISGFVRFDRMDDAEKLFEKMRNRNVISYTAMVDGFARNGRMDLARKMFDIMPERNAVSWSAMISGYVENRSFEEARYLFDQMPEKNVIAITAMITGYCKEGNVETARNLFEGICYKDIISWNAMIAGHSLNGFGEEALHLQIRMMKEGTRPDHATLIAVLTACSALSLLHRGRQNHAISIKSRLDFNISLSNALMTMYSKCGSICDSELVFQTMQRRDLVSWNTILAAFAQHGLYQKVLSFFQDMDTTEFFPNGVTFLNLLSACGHSGKVDESLHWFHLMVTGYGIMHGPEHYACLINILCRAGMLEKACKYIKDMPFAAKGTVWGALLGAYHMHKSLRLGELAAERLLQLGAGCSGAYVMLSNIYAAVGRWDGVTNVRELMKRHSVKKQPAYSWIEISNKVHVCLVGDSSHPEIGQIVYQLNCVSSHMKSNDEINFFDLSDVWLG